MAKPKEKSTADKLREAILAGSMDPGGIFYDAGSGGFYVDVGEHYRRYSRKGPVQTGVQRFLENTGVKADEAKDEGKRMLADIEVTRAVDWSGSIAGHKRGLFRHPGVGSLLITSQPKVPSPKPGKFDIIAGIIEQLLSREEPIQSAVFYAWIKGAYEAVRSGVHQPAPLLALAGPVNCGKSLVAWIVAQLLGGRIGHPHPIWSGGILWNDDLIGAEFLLIDDSVGSTDYRNRIAFASNFKEAVYGAEVQMRKRHTSSISVRPVWRCLACVNDTPESLEVLPPITEDMADKIILLAADPVKMPVDTTEPGGKERLQALIRSELPALAHHLLTLDTPNELRDSRSGVVAWRHHRLVEALDGITPAQQLRELIVMGFDEGLLGSPMDPVVKLTSAKLESILTHFQAPTAAQAKTLLKGAKQVGRYLGELSKKPDGLVTKLKLNRGTQRWKLTPPE